MNIWWPVCIWKIALHLWSLGKYINKQWKSLHQWNWHTSKSIVGGNVVEEETLIYWWLELWLLQPFIKLFVYSERIKELSLLWPSKCTTCHLPQEPQNSIYTFLKMLSDIYFSLSKITKIWKQPQVTNNR